MVLGHLTIMVAPAIKNTMSPTKGVWIHQQHSLSVRNILDNLRKEKKVNKSKAVNTVGKR